MLILHTSDWHLGATFHDRARDQDEDHALDQIVAVARDRRVDAVVIAGDVFDTANPGAAEQRRWYRTLQRLVEEAGVGSVLAIAGNHDSGLRLEGPRELLSVLKVELRGLLPRDGDPAASVVPVRDRVGIQRAWAALVPYLREGDLLRPGDDLGTDRAQRLALALHRRWGEVRGAVPAGLPWLAVGHAFATGGSLGGSEAPVLVEVGNLGQAEVAALADGCSYAAFGHLHRPQAIARREHWRYSGALLPTGFDEAGQERSIVLAELPNDGGPAAVEVVPLRPYRDYRRLTGSRDAVLTQILALPAAAADGPVPWLQAILHLDQPVPGLARTVADAAASRGWSCVATQLHRGGAAAGQVYPAAALPELGGIDPTEVFAMLHRQTYASEPTPELAADFAHLLATVQGR